MAPRYVLRWHNSDDVASMWYQAQRHRSWRRARLCSHKHYLAQLVEHKGLNLVVMGSSPIVDVFINTFYLYH
jgi:hypothetical protein